MMQRFTDAAAKAFEKARETSKGALAKLRVDRAREKREEDRVFFVQARKRRRLKEADQRRHERGLQRLNDRRELERTHTQFVVEQQSRVAAGEIGTPAMQRNVRAAIVNNVRSQELAAMNREGVKYPNYQTFHAELERRVQQRLQDVMA